MAGFSAYLYVKGKDGDCEIRFDFAIRDRVAEVVAIATTHPSFNSRPAAFSDYPNRIRRIQLLIETTQAGWLIRFPGKHGSSMNKDEPDFLNFNGSCKPRSRTDFADSRSLTTR